MAKRNKNWTEIEVRYKSGERPVDIAKDFRDCSAKQISLKASRSGWVREKEALCNSIASEALEATHNELKELCNLNARIHFKFLKQLEENMHLITNPYLLDGERVNSLFQTAMNNATKIMLALYGQDEETRNSVNRIQVEFKTPRLGDASSND